MNISDLPALNAGLNALSGTLLGVGYAMIRRGRVRAHKVFMLAAVGVSTLFLVSYVVYHYHAGSTRFPGMGWVRTLYLSILVTHAVLAAAVIPLAAVTLVRAWREDFPSHRRIARWTLPIWFYVSVTGVIIYVMLYHLYAR